jgi:hypothetical protein
LSSGNSQYPIFSSAKFCIPLAKTVSSIQLKFQYAFILFCRFFLVSVLKVNIISFFFFVGYFVFKIRCTLAFNVYLLFCNKNVYIIIVLINGCFHNEPVICSSAKFCIPLVKTVSSIQLKFQYAFILFCRFFLVSVLKVNIHFSFFLIHV